MGTMSSRLSSKWKFRLQLAGIVASILVMLAGAGSLAESARLVDVVGTAGGAFAAGAGFANLMARRRRRREEER
jgi:hypothetical protein